MAEEEKKKAPVKKPVNDKIKSFLGKKKDDVKKGDDTDNEKKSGKPVDKDAPKSNEKTKDEGKASEDKGKGTPSKEKAAQPEKKATSGRGKAPAIKDPVKIEFEPEVRVEELEYILEGDTSDIEEHRDIIEAYLTEIDELGEAISIAGRMKKKAVMRRAKSRIQRGRARSMRKYATSKTINKRARRSAIATIKKRFSGNRAPNKLSYSERGRVERMVQRRKGAVNRMQRRLIRVKRAQERARHSRK